MFISIELHAILCVRVFLNFVMLVYYRSYDKRTLRYIEYILNRFYKLKDVFRKCKVNKKTKKKEKIEHFNFFKYYVLVYWIDYIKKYSNSIEYNNSTKEIIYKKIKLQYNKTNKQESYQKQILYYYIRKINLLSIIDNLKKNAINTRFCLTRI